MIGSVVIDGRAAQRPETGGVERWARELCARLPLIDPDRFTVADPGPRFAHRLGHIWEQTVLPATARRRGSALLCPANLAPVLGDRNIVVIHDAAPLRFPGDFSTAYRSWQSFLLPRLADRALRVIVPSEFSRSEVVELCGADPELVKVVHGGVPDACSPDVDPGPVRARFGLDRPYVLTVASKVARKNLAVLGPVAADLAAEGLDFVAVGGGRPQFGSAADGGSGVRELGAVDDSLLPGLYAGAEAFVLPSIYEGFGLPVCEAMACGTPVVCSDRTALPEAAGGAALLVDPLDPGAIAQALLKACFDTKEAVRLVDAGLARVRGLDWNATAEGVAAVCADACDW